MQRIVGLLADRLDEVLRSCGLAKKRDRGFVLVDRQGIVRARPRGGLVQGRLPRSLREGRAFGLAELRLHVKYNKFLARPPSRQ